jgi:hypothetical protein
MGGWPVGWVPYLFALYIHTAGSRGLALDRAPNFFHPELSAKQFVLSQNTCAALYVYLVETRKKFQTTTEQPRR